MKNRLHLICWIVAFGLPLGVYYYTAAPGPFWGDSSIFSMVAATLSIPHSPGFPLWVLAGKLFTWLVPHNPARATNLMCGFFGAGAVALFYLCTQKILTRLNDSFTLEENTDTRTGAPTIALTALGAALIFAFSQTVWLQAVRAEVYSLQLFLTLAIVWFALCLPESEQPTRLFLLAVLLWGLSAAVHPLLSISALPGLLIMGCFKSVNWKKELSKWGWAFGLVMLAASVYLFLPIRSAQDPYLNWNQPDNWERFISAVTRSRSWKVSIDSTPANLGYANVMRLGSFLLSEYSIIFWIFALTGILALAHFNFGAGAALFVLLLSNLLVTLWATEFNTWNMDLLGYLSFGTGLAVLSAVIGPFMLTLWASHRFKRLISVIRWAVPLAVGVFTFFLAAKNWARTDLHKSHWPGKIAEETLRSLPPNAVVFYSSDRLLTPVWYQQGALGQRRDVAIVLPNAYTRRLLWEQTRRRHPDLVLDSSFLGASLGNSMGKAFQKLCQQNRRPIFCQLGKQLSDCRHLWPAGYLLEYRPEPVGPEVPKQVVDFVLKTFSGEPDFMTRENLGLEIYNWGSYLSKIGAQEAENLIVRAAEFDSENPRTWTALGKGYFLSKRFGLAEQCFSRALSYDPYMGENYLFLAQSLGRQGKLEEATKTITEGGWLVPDKLKPMGQENEKTER